MEYCSPMRVLANFLTYKEVVSFFFLNVDVLKTLVGVWFFRGDIVVSKNERELI